MPTFDDRPSIVMENGVKVVTLPDSEGRIPYDLWINNPWGVYCEAYRAKHDMYPTWREAEQQVYPGSNIAKGLPNTPPVPTHAFAYLHPPNG